jgi:soluble lytic murein transglycosylase-like protein
VALIAILAILYLLSRKNDTISSPGIMPISYSDTIDNVVVFAQNIIEVANIKLIDPALICAIIAVESEGDPNASRPLVNPKYFGLMQISLDTARWRGYRGSNEGLLDPDINIFYGADYLEYQISRYRSYTLGVSAYQRGSVAYDTSGMLVNMNYVNSVARFYDSFREHFMVGVSGYMETYPDSWTA